MWLHNEIIFDGRDFERPRPGDFRKMMWPLSKTGSRNLLADSTQLLSPTISSNIPISYPMEHQTDGYLVFFIRCQISSHFQQSTPPAAKISKISIDIPHQFAGRRRLFQQVLALQSAFGPLEFSSWSYLKEYSMWEKVFRWKWFYSWSPTVGPTRLSRFLFRWFQWPWSAKAMCFLKKLK